MKIEIKKIKVNPNNPRFIKNEKYLKLIKSLKDFPEMLEKRPLVIDENNIILWGNMRFRACQELWFQEIDVIIAKDWSEEQKREFLIKDNINFGEWDMNELANSRNTNLLDEWGFDLPIENKDEEIDFDNIQSNENRETQDKQQNISCPKCSHNFTI